MRSNSLAVAAALALVVVPSPASGLVLCGMSNAYKPSLTDSCGSVNGGDGGWPVVTVNAARGEIEAGAVFVDNTASPATGVPGVTISLEWDAGAPPAGVEVAAPRLVAYVHTEASPRYAGSVAGWFADALLPWPSVGVSVLPGSSISSWISFNVTAGAAPGNYTGTLTAQSSSAGTGAKIPFLLRVFDVTIPPLTDDAAFTTVYAFDDHAPANLYGEANIDVNATLRAYWSYLADVRFPATNIYATAPLPLWIYEALAAEGAQLLILADISSLPFTDDGEEEEEQEEALGAGGESRSSAAVPSARPRALSSRSRPSAGRRAGVSASVACPTFSPSYISQMVALLKPTWDALGALGLQHKAAVYGFDEIDASCEPAVRQLFSAAKAAFPNVTTISAIDWPTVPLDEPLDVWVLQYQLVNAVVAQQWVEGGRHELFVYHCIEPSQAGFLNTFNERRLVEARLLFWYDFLLGVTGHLYYDDALWIAWSPLPPFWTSYTTVSNVTFPPAHGPLAVLAPGDDARLLNWDPANWIWAPRTDIWANGDGVFLYPGSVDPATRTGTPISTVRFEAQRDGVEEWHVMRAIADRAQAEAVVSARVSAPTTWSANVTLLEEARVALLALAENSAGRR